jgi:hypothetical protein
MTDELTVITMVSSPAGNFRAANAFQGGSFVAEPISASPFRFSTVKANAVHVNQPFVRVNAKLGRRNDPVKLTARVRRSLNADDAFEIYAEKIDAETARWINSL